MFVCCFYLKLIFMYKKNTEVVSFMESKFIIISDDSFFRLGAESILRPISNEIVYFGDDDLMSSIMNEIYKDRNRVVIICKNPELYVWGINNNNVLVLSLLGSLKSYIDTITAFCAGVDTGLSSVKKLASALTANELQMFYFFKSGLTDEEISSICNKPTKSISLYRRKIISKLDLKNKVNFYKFCNQMSGMSWSGIMA